MNWDEVIETGKEMHEEKKKQKLPDEMSFEEFMEKAGVGKFLATALLKNLLEAGVIEVRVVSGRKYYRPRD